MKTMASVLSVLIGLIGSWTGSSRLRTQLDISASVSQDLQVSEKKPNREHMCSHTCSCLLTITDFM